MNQNKKNKELKKRSTSIMEDARLVLDITRDDYALCQYIHYRSADPRQAKRGWCCDTKEDLAFFVGISRVGIYKMIDRLEGLKLIETDPTTGFVCACAHWIDTENEHREKANEKKSNVNKVDTLPKDDVNKVYNECKQSLQDSVNKVTPNIKVEYDNKIDKEEEKEKPIAISQPPTPSLPETIPLEEEEKKAPPVPVAPPAARRYDHQVFPNAQKHGPFSLETGIAEIRGNQVMRDAFSMTRRVPAELFESYLTEFGLEQAAVDSAHHNLADFRKHFLNYSAKRYESEQKRKAADAPKPVHSRIPRY